MDFVRSCSSRIRLCLTHQIVKPAFIPGPLSKKVSRQNTLAHLNTTLCRKEWALFCWEAHASGEWVWGDEKGVQPLLTSASWPEMVRAADFGEKHICTEGLWSWRWGLVSLCNCDVIVNVASLVFREKTSLYGGECEYGVSCILRSLRGDEDLMGCAWTKEPQS